jgi:hypothetical protein
MLRNFTFILILCIIFYSCNNNFGIKEIKDNLQNTSVSKADSLLMDSATEYYYYSASYFKKTLVMRGMVFFLGYNQKVYLFSTLHNFTGVDPDSRKLVKGLIHYPTDIFIAQSYFVRPDLLKDLKNFKMIVRLYNSRDSIQDYRNRPDGGKHFKLYEDEKTLYISAKNKAGNSYDIGAYEINDSTPLPRHILNFDEKWTSDVVHVGDTVFYCGSRRDEYSQTPGMFIGKIKATPTRDNLYITSDVFSRPGSSGAAVFKLSNHKASLIGVIARGNSDENIVFITPFKEAFALLKL